MSFVRLLFIYSLAMPGQLFAADAQFDWAQIKRSYETVYQEIQPYLGEPVDRGRIPKGSKYLNAYKGFYRYQLAESHAYAFGITSADQRKDLIKKIDFLFHLIFSCGQMYSVKPIDVKTEVAGKEEFFYFLLKTLTKIANTLKNEDYVDERKLNGLFSFIGGAIEQLGKSEHSKELIDLMYVPIKDWITNSFPISHMLKYVVNTIVNRPERSSGGCCVESGHRFDYGTYFNKYYLKKPEYEKINEWIGEGPIFFGQKNNADQEFKNFEQVAVVPFNPNKLLQDEENFCAFIRYIESIHNKGESLLKKWNDVIDSEIAEKALESQNSAAVRAAKTKKTDKGDPKEVLAAMMAAMGLEADQPSSTVSKKKNTTSKKAKTGKTALTKPDRDAEVEEAEQRRLRAQPALEEEEKRQVHLAETHTDKAKRNAALEQRQKELQERKSGEAAAHTANGEAVANRKQSWVDALYDAQEKLSSYKSDSLIDPAIFEESSADDDLDAAQEKPDPHNPNSLIDPAVFGGSANFKRVCKELKNKGIYLGLQSRGNEKCVAMWKDCNGRNCMVWFDAPHGAQIKKGSMAGWAVALHKALRDSGRLLSLK